mgnify:FL=1
MELLADVAKGRERERVLSGFMRRTSIEEGVYAYFAETDEDYRVIRNTTIDQFVKAGVLLSRLTHQSLVILAEYGENTDKFMTDRGLKVNIQNPLLTLPQK